MIKNEESFIRDIEKFDSVQAYLNRNTSAVIGTNLRRIRIDHGYSLNTVSVMTESPYHALLRLERGESAKTTIERCRKLAGLYNMPLEDFLQEITKDAPVTEAFSGKNFFNSDLSEIYPFNILKAIDSDLDLRDYDPYKIVEAVNRLTERERTVLELRYENNLTLAETGKEFGVTRERIRQLEERALRKLSHKEMRDSMKRISFEEYSGLKTEIADLRRKLKYYEGSDEDNNENFYLPLEEMDVSVRTFNCFSKKGLKTAGAIAQLSNEEILRVRNLGRKSIREIQNKLDELGVKRNFNIPA